MITKMTVWLLCSRPIPKFPVQKTISSGKNNPLIFHVAPKNKANLFQTWTNSSKNPLKCPIEVSSLKSLKANNIKRAPSSLTESKALLKGILICSKTQPKGKKCKDPSHYTWTKMIHQCQQWTFSSSHNQKATMNRAFYWWERFKTPKETLRST